MKLTLWLGTLGAAVTQAAYSGDIVQYWVDQTAILVNGTIIGGLQSPPSAWTLAIVQGAQYLAAIQSQGHPLDFQQLAVSHAAHNSLQWIFHGTRNYGAVDIAFKSISVLIGIDLTSASGVTASAIGRRAAGELIRSRADDGANTFVDYVFGPQVPGVYQATPGGTPLPDTPQFRYVKLFADVGNAAQFIVPPPPSVNETDYQTYVLYVKEQGARNSTVRTAHDTDTAYFWRESAPTVWNRIANAVVGHSLRTDVLASAKFYAQLTFALANAGIVAWSVKFKYENWRPVTSINRPGIWLSTGLNVSDPTWQPLLVPTPSHPDYVSTHGTLAGAASAVIKPFNKGSDLVNFTFSSNVTLDNRPVITRSYTNLTAAAVEAGQSRVFRGLHFQFSSGAGLTLGQNVAEATLDKFDD